MILSNVERFPWKLELLPCRLMHGRETARSSAVRLARNVLRHLHTALDGIGAEKAGGHAFRRFRSTYLRNHTACPQSIINFWLGWGEEDMSARYDKIRADVSFRKEVAESCGVGFDVPDHLNLVEPKNEEKAVAVSA
jgi:hypothetical protein